MAAIGEIRKRSGLLIAIIGISMLAFLVMSGLDSNSSLLTGNSTSNIIGVIDGNEISIQDFDAKFQEAKESYRSSTNNPDLDENTINQIREQTWNQYIRDFVLGDKIKKSGITVSSDEIFDLVQGNNPHPYIRNSFTDPKTGVFNPSQVLVFLKNLENPQYDPSGESKKKWLGLEKVIKEDQLSKKYINLIKKGIYFPKWQVEKTFQQTSDRANLKFVQIPYATIQDSSVNITDDELSDYLSEHSEDYKQEESRKIEYVIFNILPSSDDTTEALAYVKNEMDNFKNSDNDTTYLKLYSDEGIDGNYFTIDELTSSVKDSLFLVDTNTLIGPYFEDGFYKVAKLIDRKMIPDSVKARHILIAVQEGADPKTASDKIDSLKEQIENGADFASLAVQFSDDKGSGQKGGDLGWVQPNQTVPQFHAAVFYQGGQGDLLKVRTVYGYHLIEILKSDKNKIAVKVGFLTKEVLPGMETERAIYASANEFAGKNRTTETFNASIDADDQLIKRIAENLKSDASQIPGLGAARAVVKWTYKAKEGEVSNVIELADKYVIANLVQVNEEGVQELEDIRAELELALMQDKKYELIKEKIDASASASNLEDLAGKMNTTVQTADNVSFGSAYIVGVGQEPKVIGAVFGMDEKAVSKPIQGNTGVYVVQVSSFIRGEELPDVKVLQKQMTAPITARADYGLFEALKKAAEIEDNRNNFY